MSLSLWDHFVWVHDALRVEEVLDGFHQGQGLRGLLQMQILRLVQPHPVLSTDATIPLCHLCEYILIMPPHLLLIRHNVNMNIPIPNMPIPKHLLTRLPQMSRQLHPLLHIKTNIIS